MIISKKKVNNRQIHELFKKYKDLEARYQSELLDNEVLFDNNKKILLVEDNYVNAKIAEELLKSIELEVDYAENGLEAIKICEGKSANYYSVILMDIVMPIMDGYEATNIIKEEMGIKTPVLAVTATLPDPNRKNDAYRNIDGYILKPFDVNGFKATVLRYLV